MPNPWDDRSRVSAAERFRSQSAQMGADATLAIVNAVSAQPGHRVLDIASGTGEPAISLAALVGPAGHVTATDISAEPLKLGEARAARRGLDNITFQIADAQQLPFPDAAFDRVSCRLGLMFFPDLERALREVHRVLAPSGRFAALVWGPAHQPYFDATLARIQRHAGITDLPPSAAKMFKLADPGALTAALKQAGFDQAEERLQHIRWNWAGTPEDLWDYWQEITVPFRPLLEAVPAERRAELDAEVISALRQYYDGVQVHFAAQFILATATRE